MVYNGLTQLADQILDLLFNFRKGNGVGIFFCEEKICGRRTLCVVRCAKESIIDTTLY